MVRVRPHSALYKKAFTVCETRCLGSETEKCQVSIQRCALPSAAGRAMFKPRVARGLRLESTRLASKDCLQASAAGPLSHARNREGDKS